MSYAEDRMLGQVNHRIDMMITRGVVTIVDDADGLQTLQVAGFYEEVLDAVERFQSFGISSVPVAGSEVLIGCIGGNRDNPVVLAVNDRASRPVSLKPGETVLYNNANVTLLLNAEGELVVKAKRMIVAVEETIEIEAGERISLKAPSVEINP